MFPIKADGTDDLYAEAPQFCKECGYKEPCLEIALENREQFGFWGGTNPIEREEILYARRSL